MKLTLFRLSAILFGVAGFIIGIVGATGGTTGRTQLTLGYFLSLFRGSTNDNLAAFALTLSGIAIALFIGSALKLGFSKSYTHFATHFHDGNCFPRACTDADIPTIVGCAGDYFSTATNLEQTMRLHRLDRRIFTIYETTDARFIGYSCIVRLSAKGVASIRRGDFSIINIPVEYIRKDSKTECDIYIGAICCTRLFTRGFVLGRVYGNIELMKPKAIYARAATVDGLRILKRRKFSALNKDGVGQIYYIEG